MGVRYMRSQTGKNSRPSNTALADRLSIQDYLNLKEELRFRIVRLVPKIVQSAYFYGSIATGDISPGLSDPDIYVVLKTEKGELSGHVIKRLFRELWDLAIHPIYNRVWGVHWIHFDTDINVDRTLSNPLALLTYLYRSEFIAGEKLNLPKPDYDKILIWMREFMTPLMRKSNSKNGYSLQELYKVRKDCFIFSIQPFSSRRLGGCSEA